MSNIKFMWRLHQSQPLPKQIKKQKKKDKEINDMFTTTYPHLPINLMVFFKRKIILLIQINNTSIEL